MHWTELLALPQVLEGLQAASPALHGLQGGPRHEGGLEDWQVWVCSEGVEAGLEGLLLFKARGFHHERAGAVLAGLPLTGCCLALGRRPRQCDLGLLGARALGQGRLHQRRQGPEGHTRLQLDLQLLEPARALVADTYGVVPSALEHHHQRSEARQFHILGAQRGCHGSAVHSNPSTLLALTILDVVDEEPSRLRIAILPCWPSRELCSQRLHGLGHAAGGQLLTGLLVTERAPQTDGTRDHPNGNPHQHEVRRSGME
mmetsp:Transcript_35142/g.81006  ORF Transcript_35142/g.81006 Transcript_35142/m.81006 type:complete len:258 (-) Transcript_35142:102-875(-)